MGCHDYPKSSRNVQPARGSISTLTSHSPLPLYLEVGGDLGRHPPEALLPEERLVVPRGCHSQTPAATPPSASAWPSAWLPARTNGKKNCARLGSLGSGSCPWLLPSSPLPWFLPFQSCLCLRAKDSLAPRACLVCPAHQLLPFSA